MNSSHSFIFFFSNWLYFKTAYFSVRFGDSSENTEVKKKANTKPWNFLGAFSLEKKDIETLITLNEFQLCFMLQ